MINKLNKQQEHNSKDSKFISLAAFERNFYKENPEELKSFETDVLNPNSLDI